MSMLFTEWIARWQPAEYNLFRTRSRGITFLGATDLTRRFDTCLASDSIDLDDPIMSDFKSALVREGIILSARADEIFAAMPPDSGGGTGGDGIPEAPQDNSIYGRQNANWVAVGSAGGAGPPGPSGPQGDVGPAGADGAAGLNGADGAQGQQGPQGDSGPQGTQGPQGPAGTEGAQGPAGEAGTQGIQGDPGAQGSSGAEGVQGLPGLPGAAGSQGAQGPQGAPGNEGPAGPQGAQGDQGSVGPQGTVGPEGPQGVIGPAGPPGAEGAQGALGPQGAPGPSSDTWGFTYNNNPAEPPASQQFRFDNTDTHAATKIWISNTDLDGVDVANYLSLIEINDELYTQDKNDSTTYDVFTVTASPLNKGTYSEIAIAWARGSATTVVNNQAAIISLMRKGSVGAQGPQGAAGPEGQVGPQGPQGIQGQQGPQGDVGPQGAAGAQGPQGPAGTTGAEGQAGPAGAQGVPGTAGTSGTQGAQGPAGAQGAQGTAGTQGPAGTQGVQGPQGIPGPTAVSANAGNTASLGTDNLIFVPTLPSASNAIPAMDATATVGVATSWSRGDHVHPTDTSRMARVGTMAADQAAAGMIGEVLSTSITTGVTLASGAAKDIGTLSLPAGDYDVSAQLVFNPGTNLTIMAAAISLTSNTLPTAAQLAAGTGAMQQLRATFAGSAAEMLQTGVTRVNVAVTTTVYMVAQVTGTGTWTATGFLRARRMR